MAKIKIITDSYSDLTDELMNKYDIDYAIMNIVHHGKKEFATLNKTPSEVHEFYGKLKNGERLALAQVNPEDFKKIFTKYLKLGYDIIYIGNSSKISKSVETAEKTALQLLEKYPDHKTNCIDSQNISFGEGLLAIEAAKLVQQNLNFQEIVQWILENRIKVNQVLTVQTFDFIKKSGILHRQSTCISNFSKIKPIIISDANGNQTILKKIRGRENSLIEIVNSMKEIVDSENQTIYITHGDCSQQEVQFLVNLIKTNFPCKEIFIGYMGPAMGTLTGPESIGIWTSGKTLTFCAEKKIRTKQRSDTDKM